MQAMRRILTTIAFALLTFFSMSARESYVLDNGKIRAAFSGGDVFAIEEIVMDGQKLAGGGSIDFWHLSLLGPMGETPLYRPKVARYQGAEQTREGSLQKICFTWFLRLDYDGFYPLRATVRCTCPWVFPAAKP